MAIFKKRSDKVQQRKSNRRRPDRQLGLENLEARQLLTTYNVCGAGSDHQHLLDETYSQEVYQSLRMQTFELQPLGDVSIRTANAWADYDEYSIQIPADKLAEGLPQGMAVQQWFATWMQDLNSVTTTLDGSSTAGRDEFLEIMRFQKLDKPVSVGDVIEIDIPSPGLFRVVYTENADIVVTQVTDQSVRVATIVSDRQRVGNVNRHPVSGSREFGFEENQDGSVTFYTRGVDSSDTPFVEYLGRDRQSLGWQKLMQGIGERFGLDATTALNSVRGINGNTNGDYFKTLARAPSCHVPPTQQPLKPSGAVAVPPATPDERWEELVNNTKATCARANQPFKVFPCQVSEIARISNDARTDPAHRLGDAEYLLEVFEYSLNARVQEEQKARESRLLDGRTELEQTIEIVDFVIPDEINLGTPFNVIMPGVSHALGNYLTRYVFQDDGIEIADMLARLNPATAQLQACFKEDGIFSVIVGIDHFENHLAPGFRIGIVKRVERAYEASLITDGNGKQQLDSKRFDANLKAVLEDIRNQHEFLLEHAVPAGFDNLHAAGEVTACQKTVAQLTVPLAARYLREQTIKKILKGRGVDYRNYKPGAVNKNSGTDNNEDSPAGGAATESSFLGDTPTQDELFSLELYEAGTLGVQTSPDEFFLRVGEQYQVSVIPLTPDANETGPFEYIVLTSSGEELVDVSDEGLITVVGTAGAFINEPTPLYILVHDGQDWGIGQFAIVDTDLDSDGLADSVESSIGFDPGVTEQATRDTDSDGLPDLVEQALGTSSTEADTDGDGTGDHQELTTHGDPAAADATPLSSDQMDAMMQQLSSMVSALAASDGGSSDSPASATNAEDESTDSGQALMQQSSALSEELPVVGRPLNEVMDVEGVLRTSLLDPLAQLFAKEQVTTIEVINVLRQVDIHLGATRISIDPESVTGGFYSNDTEAELRFDVSLSATRELLEQSFDESMVLDGLGISVHAPETISITAELAFDFSFGLNLLEGQVNKKAFVRPRSLDASVKVAASDIEMDLDGSFADLELTGGMLDVAGGVRFAFNNPDQDHRGSITLDEWLGAHTTDVITIESAGLFDVQFQADLSGQLLPGLNIQEKKSQPSRIRYSLDEGFSFDASIDAFGLDIDLLGMAKNSDDYEFAVSTDAFQLGSQTLLLDGFIGNHPGSEPEYALETTINHWQPVPSVDIESLTVQLDSRGVTLETTTDLAGLSDVHLSGDYDFSTKTYSIAAEATVDWTPIKSVNVTLEEVQFSITNRNRDGSLGETQLSARGEMELFGTDFLAAAALTPSGVWVAASPQEQWKPIPGLTVKDATVVLSSYDFVMNLTDTVEVHEADADSNVDHRQIRKGINLVGSSTLPSSIPAVGGSEVQIAGLIGTTLADMEIEAKLALANPPVIADMLAFDSVGLRITGTPSLSVFGDARVLPDRIPGLNQEIAVQAGLTLDLLNTTLSGYLSLQSPIENVFGVEGLTIVEGDGEFGINFGTTPLPLPTVGFNLSVMTPESLQDRLSLPSTVDASLNVSTTEPILALAVSDWQPLAPLGIDDVDIHEASIVVAPNGGTIGLKTFPRGISASFDATLFDTDVRFMGVFDEQTKGIELEAYVEGLDIAGVEITGFGPDGIYEDGIDSSTENYLDPDADNGAYFHVALTPQSQAMEFSGRVNLPGEDDEGNPAHVELAGEIGTTTLALSGSVNSWTLVPGVVTVNRASFLADISIDTPSDSQFAFSGDFDLMDANIGVAGALNKSGISLSGSLTDGPQFAGMGIEEFTFSFSTVPEDQHLYVGFFVDLPGAGGRTHVEGTVRDRMLSLYGEIIDWRPLPTIHFDGSLQAEADLDAGSFEFAFDAHAEILGSWTHMTGHLASSPSGFELYAMGVVELAFPDGTKIADLAATIDVNSDSHFDIDLAADFKLPGYRPALVQLGGNIGTTGVGIHADVDDWRLIPGLAFDGTLDVQTDFQAKQLSLFVDVHTDLLGSNLDLEGQLLAGVGQFDLDLYGHIDFGNTKAGLFGISLDAWLQTSSTTGQYSLGFDGHMTVLGAKLDAMASLEGDADGNWRMQVDVGIEKTFELDLEIIVLSAGFDAGLSVTFGSAIEDFSIAIEGSIFGRIEVPKLGSVEKSVSGRWELDLGSGMITIPSLRPEVTYKKACVPKVGCAKIPTGVRWKDLDLDIADPEPTTTVTARRAASLSGSSLGRETLQIRGGAGPESVQVLPTSNDRLLVRARNGNGDWVRLLETPRRGLDGIDVNLAGGNDQITISPEITLPTILRGGPGRDVIRGGSGPNTIYGGNGPLFSPVLMPNTDASLSTGETTSTAVTSTNVVSGSAAVVGQASRLGATTDAPALAIPRSELSTPPVSNGPIRVPSELPTTTPNTPSDQVPPIPGLIMADRGDQLFGGSANDHIYGEGGDDVIIGGGGDDVLEGGTGIDIVDGTLRIEGSRYGEQIQVLQGETEFSSAPLAPGQLSDRLTVEPAIAGSNQLVRPEVVTPQISHAVAATDISVPRDQIAVTPTQRPDLPTSVDPSQFVVRMARGNGPWVTVFTTLRSHVHSLQIDALGGNDTIDVRSVRVPTTIHAGDGDDVVRGGKGPNQLYGGAGNDRLFGGAAVDAIFGEEGNDKLVAGNTADSLEGGVGDNFILPMENVGAVGDYNGDDRVDAHDVDLLRRAIDSQMTESHFDLNHDGRFDYQDVDQLVHDIAQTRDGDSDLDGDVDFADFVALSSKFGTSVQSWSDGDFDGDGTVAFADFIALSKNFGFRRG